MFPVRVGRKNFGNVATQAIHSIGHLQKEGDQEEEEEEEEEEIF